MSNRRCFIKSGAIALFAAGIGGVPLFVAQAAAANKHVPLYKKKKILVSIFQRGGMDGLMAVTPFNDKYLKEGRPGLFISAAKSVTSSPLIDLDGKFGLHPSMKAFENLFNQKQLAIVHAVGSVNKSRSHFESADYIESGTPFNKFTNTGWLNRATGMLDQTIASTFQSVSLTGYLPRSFYGDYPSLVINNLQDFAVKLWETPSNIKIVEENIQEMYSRTDFDLLKKSGKESFSATKMLENSDIKNYKPSNNAVYPDSQLGNSLKQIAQLIKMDVGLEIAFTDSNGWDTHYNQGSESGIFANNASDLSNSINAFWTDISSYHDEVTVMTMTEFGRTVHQNGTGGTDHGRGSCLFIVGNDVKGGLVHGNMPELSKENLEDFRDVPVTTDIRSIFSEVAGKHLNIHNDQILFPGWNGHNIGVMKS